MDRRRLLIAVVAVALVTLVGLLSGGCQMSCTVGGTQTTVTVTTVPAASTSAPTTSGLGSTSVPDTVPTTTTILPSTSAVQQTVSTTLAASTTASTANAPSTSLVLTQPTIDLQPVDTWTRFDETHLMLQWQGQWETAFAQNAWGGSYRVTYEVQGAVVIQFEGTSVRVIGMKSQTGGVAKATIDSSVYWIDFRADTLMGPVSTVVWTSPGLNDGRHALTIELTDQKLYYLPGEDSRNFAIDAVEVVGTLVE